MSVAGEVAGGELRHRRRDRRIDLGQDPPAGAQTRRRFSKKPAHERGASLVREEGVRGLRRHLRRKPGP